MRKILVAVFCLVFWVFLTAFSSAQPVSAQSGPTFTPADCADFDLNIGFDETNPAQCGYVTVPEVHQQPDGPQIELAVLILPNPSGGPTAASPFVITQGGPGGATIETYAFQLTVDSPLRQGRDVILFDQRGTGLSKPSLACPELLTLTKETLNVDLTLEEGNQRYNQSALACRDRLLTEGVNLAAFNSFENAADVDALRQSLGYEQIDLYGVSYGTLLALHTLRDFSDGLRSVVLDAVVPPQVNFITMSPSSINRAFSELFQSCAADAECNAAYPNLEAVFDETMAALNQTPANIILQDLETNETYPTLFDGDAFQSSLFQILYSSQLVPWLPKVIYDAREGNFDFLSSLLGQLYFDRTMSYGMYYSVVCAEDADFTLQDIPLEGVRPSIADNEVLNQQAMLDLCARWAVPALGPRADEPVVSSVPTLVLSGQFDPITPPAFGAIAAETLTNRYVVVFPSGSHGAATTGDCEDGIIAEFLNNPQRAPSTTCILEQKMDFFTQGEFVPLPILGRLLNFDNRAVVQVIILTLGLLGMSTALLVWPLLWLVRKLRRRPQAPVPVFATLGRLVGLFTPLPLILFLVLVLVGGFQLALENDFMVLFGLPNSYRLAMLLPWLGLGTGVLTALATLYTWVKSVRTLGDRIYDTLVVLSSLGAFVILAVWQTFFALFR